MAPKFGVAIADLDAAAAFAQGGGLPAVDPMQRAVLVLARAASSSPARIDAEVVRACREGRLGAVGVVEVVSWLAMLQLLHRLMGFYGDGTS